MSASKPETILAPFAKTMLVEMGYEVRSELHHIDIVGRDSDGLFHAVELKKNFGLDVINQGLRSQAWAGMASIVVPAPNKKTSQKSAGAIKKIREWRRLCSRLDIGLYIVDDLDTGTPVLRMVSLPKRISNGRLRKSLEKEFSGRSEDLNIGGSTGVCLFTAFTEKSCKVARHFLDEALRIRSNPHLKSRDVAEKTGVPTANNLLYVNIFGWYRRIGRGVYTLDVANILAEKSLYKIEAVTGPIDRNALSDILQSSKIRQESREDMVFA